MYLPTSNVFARRKPALWRSIYLLKASRAHILTVGSRRSCGLAQGHWRCTHPQAAEGQGVPCFWWSGKQRTCAAVALIRLLLQVLASEKFSKIVDVLRQKTKSDQLVRVSLAGF